MNKIPPRLQRMRISLHNFDFDLRYVPGKELLLADHLNRAFLPNTESSDEKKIEAYVMTIKKHLSVSDIRMNEFKSETDKDKELQEVIRYVKS